MTEAKIFGKESFVRAIKDKTGATLKDATMLFETVVGIAKEAADEGFDVRLPGLGTLKQVTLEAGEARNPSNGATVAVPERTKYSLKSKPVARA